MNIQQRNLILKDIEQQVKPLMKNLYIKWRSVQSSEISELFFYYIFKHRHEKVMALISKRNKIKLKNQKLKEKLENMVVKSEFEAFENNLK